MPKIAAQLDKFVFVRSVFSWAAVHGLAQTWAQKSRNPTGVLGDLSPHIGSVVSLESQAQRKPGDILPGFVGLGTSSMIGSGYMSSRYAPLVVPSVSTAGLPSVKPANPAVFAERYALLQTLDTDRAPGAPYGDVPADMADFYTQAKSLADSPTINTVFGYTTADYARYGSTQFGGTAIIAKQILASNQGTRFVQLTTGGWDNHANIYAANGGLFSQMKFFDPAVGTLIADLASTPGAASGKSLLDETLVVMIGEFGRTVGPVNAQGGRDHYQRMSVAFAGGGVRGGRAVGVTDASPTRSSTTAGAAIATSASRTSRPRSTPRSASTTRPCSTTIRSAAATSTCRLRRTASTSRSTKCSEEGDRAHFFSPFSFLSAFLSSFSFFSRP